MSNNENIFLNQVQFSIFFDGLSVGDVTKYNQALKNTGLFEEDKAPELLMNFPDGAPDDVNRLIVMSGDKKLRVELNFQKIVIIFYGDESLIWFNFEEAFEKVEKICRGMDLLNRNINRVGFIRQFIEKVNREEVVSKSLRWVKIVGDQPNLTEFSGLFNHEIENGYDGKIINEHIDFTLMTKNTGDQLGMSLLADYNTKSGTVSWNALVKVKNFCMEIMDKYSDEIILNRFYEL